MLKANQINIYQNNKANLLADDILDFPNYLFVSLLNGTSNVNQLIHENNDSQQSKYDIELFGIKSGGSLPILLVELFTS